MAFITDQLTIKLDASNPSSYPGSGTAWNDVSGLGRNATLINGPTFSSTNGGVINFDGTNDYATVPYNIDFRYSSTVSKTVQCWVKFNAMEAKFFGAAFTGASGFDGWGIGTSPTGQIRFLTNTTIEKYTDTPTSTVTTGTWYFVTAVFKISNTIGDIKIYINDTNIVNNGRHGGTTGVVGTPPLQIATLLGGVAGQDNYFDGSVGEFYMYNKELTAQEISDNYNATKNRYLPRIVKYYDGANWQNSIGQKVWNGSAWIDWDSKYWDGSSWVSV
jgi:hypothetical protein